MVLSDSPDSCVSLGGLTYRLSGFPRLPPARFFCTRQHPQTSAGNADGSRSTLQACRDLDMNLVRIWGGLSAKRCWRHPSPIPGQAGIQGRCLFSPSPQKSAGLRVDQSRDPRSANNVLGPDSVLGALKIVRVFIATCEAGSRVTSVHG